MANKSSHRLQKLVHDEYGTLPYLSYCQKIVGQDQRRQGETKEMYISRLWLTNADALKESADKRTKEGAD